AASDNCLIRRTVIGVPSDSNCSSYFFPFLSAAEQEMLEICWVAKFPICLHVPEDNSTDGTGRPSTFGRSLELSSIRSTGSSNRLSRSRLPFSPENEMMWVSSAASIRATVKLARPCELWKHDTALHA